MMNSHVSPSKPDLKVRKIVAQTYLNENRIQEAVDLFAGIIRDYPEDRDTILVLGNLYLASGDGDTASVLYRQALNLDPDNQSVRRQLLLAESEADGDHPEAVPTDPQAILRLLQSLTGTSRQVAESELWEAANLLEMIVRSERPSELVEIHLDKITDLLPALIEINERQARADGNPALADGLHELKKNVCLQMESFVTASNTSHAVLSGYSSPEARKSPFSGRALLIDPGGPKVSDRLEQIEAGLAAAGCDVVKESRYAASMDVKPDVILVSDPHNNPTVLESMAAASASQVPLVVDFSDHFELMPVNHPRYGHLGLSTQAQARAYNTALLLANRVTVSSELHAASLRTGGFPAICVPDAWNEGNSLWSSRSTSPSRINLGWSAITGDVNDLLMIKRAIVRIIREFSETQVVVIGDPQAYRMLDTLAENRRIFMPLADKEEYPYQLGHFDILMVPLRNDPYRYALSDRAVMEAGVKGIPWVASPNQAIIDWQVGGLIANTQDEWYLYIRELVTNASIRSEFAKAGMAAAQNRSTRRAGETWAEVITECLKS